MPYFSIIIPVYNREKRIATAIESVLNQEFSDFELLIIDDASTDNTKAVVTNYSDARISYHRNEQNLERCNSRNIGIERAKGKYICFLDSDDYHLPNHLSSLHELIKAKKEPEGFFFTNSWNESDDGKRFHRECPDFTKFDPYTYFLRYTVNPQRWAVHKKVFEKIKFDPDITICEDMDTSLRVLNTGTPIFQLKATTTVYVAASDSFTHGDKQKAEKELHFLTKIFSRAELKNKMPKKETNRLLSMCYYHLAMKAGLEKKSGKLFQLGIKSFFLCPAGYNGKTNKTLAVTLLYGIPVIGSTCSAIMRGLKNK
jgi:glycosyltransferase involved in cell wall biosynthesis